MSLDNYGSAVSSRCVWVCPCWVLPFANLLPFSKIQKLTTPLRVYFCIYFIWNLVLDAMPLYFIGVLCHCLHHEIRVFTCQIQKAVTNLESIDIDQLETFRRRHLALSDLITHLDTLLSPCIILLLLSHVPSLACHGHIFISARHLLEMDDVVHKIQYFGLGSSFLYSIGYVLLLIREPAAITRAVSIYWNNQF